MRRARVRTIRFPAKSRSEEHTSELQSHLNLVCRLLLEKKKKIKTPSSMPKKKSPTRDSIATERTATGAISPGAKLCRYRPAVRSGVQSFFFFNDTATTEIYTLSLHDALPI